MTRPDWRVVLGATAALMFVLLVQRALPFVTVPTNLQAFWTMGFAQSFANQSLLSIHAVNFGLPEPAPIMFGLAGAYPASLFLAIGLAPADAYAATAALWLSVSFIAAWRLATSWGSGEHGATLLATLWLTLPIVSGHAGYSMVSFGIALLPLYFLATVRLWSLGEEAVSGVRIRDAIFFCGACLLSAFMDGYTFVMFAVGASLLAAFRLFRYRSGRARLALLAAAVHGSGFAIAYFLYTAYVGRSGFVGDSLDFFRAFGADVAFFFLPTATFHWFWDTLGLSVVRLPSQYFSDQSVWTTTFSLPMMIIGFLAWWRTRTRVRWASGLLVLTLFGYYMALGPSLKIDSAHTPVVQPIGQMNSMMPAELTIMPTGSGWLSEKVPGFQNMRAAYRWTALGLFGLWALSVLMLRQTTGWHRAAGMAVIGIVVLTYIPNLKIGLLEGMENRRLFSVVEDTLVADVRASVLPAERMAILPFGNDFLGGYIAARANLRAYNIGGDKNLENAQQHWPSILLQLGEIDTRFVGNILALFANQQVDVVLLPFVDLDKIGRGRKKHRPPFPLVNKVVMAPVISELRRSGLLVVDELPHFAAVRLVPQLRGKPMAEIVYQAMLSETPFPWQPPHSGMALVEGWHGPEPQHVWSKGRATLNLPVPDNCGTCYALLRFSVLMVSEDDPKTVRFALGRDDKTELWTKSLLLHDSAEHSLAIPLKGLRGLLRLTIDTTARSPSSLGISRDPRALGVALRSVDMLTTDYPLTIADKPDSRRLAFFLSEGWHGPESGHIWSKGQAVINLPLPDKCDIRDCYATLTFGVFAASKDRPVEVHFSMDEQGPASRWAKTLVTRRPDGQTFAVPMRGRTEMQRLRIMVAGATSPKALGLSEDARVIGISLYSIDIVTR